MKLNKIIAALLIGIISLVTVACGSKDSSGTSNNAGNTANTAETGEEQTFNLQLAHNLAEDHPVHIALAKFAETVKAETNGTVDILINANGTLGTERETLEQIQNGVLDMAKVSASTLENFSDVYSAFSVPYIFRDEEHFYSVMDSEIVDEIFASTEDKGFIGLTWFDSGARSFYTAKTPINKPEDLKGLKIRTMDTPSSIEMMKNLGGSATILPYGEIYTALQQGVIDGAENNPTALTLGLHGEVAKYYSFDEHTRIPDVLVISSNVWSKMSQNQKDVITKAAENSKEEFKTSWKASVEEALQKAQSEYGVQLIYPDKEAFQKAVQPMYDNLKANKPEVYEIVEKIQNYSK